MDAPPTQTRGRDVAEKLAEAAISLVPVAGGPLAVAFAYAIGLPLQRRTQDWFEELAQEINRLAESVDGLTIESLVSDDRFVDAVVTATRAAQRTHERDKLRALRNAVVSTALPASPQTDEQITFFRWIEEFTVGHIQILAYLDDPPGWYQRHEIPMKEYYAGSRYKALEVAFPEFATRPDFTNVMLGDLERSRLITASLGGMVSGRAVYDALTSQLAKRFLAFIADH